MKSINRNHSSGQIVIIFALSLVVLIGMVGLALDSGMAYGVKAKLSSAVDAAAIAGARALGTGANDAERRANAEAAAQKFFNVNFLNNYLGATPALNSFTAQHDPNGYWKVTVTASAVMPTNLIRVLNFNQFTVHALGETIRRDLDMILVLDTSGSLGSDFPTVKSAAKNFIGKFIESSDRVGLVAFSSGAELRVPINKTASRGFIKQDVTTAINALSVGGATASAEGMRRALNEINLVPAAVRSSLRVIVFFSDGAPNEVPATFARTSYPTPSPSTVTADLYSEPDSDKSQPCDKGPPGYYLYTPCRVYYSDRLDTQISTYSKIPYIAILPNYGFNITGAGNIPLASYNNNRTITYTNERCNVNKAARNMVENVANTARSWVEPSTNTNQPIAIYTLGLGNRLNTLEVSYCGYGSNENGENILRRLANTKDSDTYQAANPTTGAPPTGLYCPAANTTKLDSCFSAIASDILRLSR